jgi:cell division protein FtsQ
VTLRQQHAKSGAAVGESLRQTQWASAMLLMIGISGLCYAVVLWIAAHPVFSIRNVLVTGVVSHLNPLVVRTTVVKPMRGTFFTANLGEVKRLTESMPWVRYAQVSRSWPNTIVIHVEEHQPVARLNTDQMINTFGEAFSVPAAEAGQYRELPQFSGPVALSKLMRSRFDELKTWLAPLQSPVVRLALSDRLSWSLVLANGLTLEFGRDVTINAIEERALRLATTWDSTVKSAGLPSRIDLRYVDGYAIQSPSLRINTPDRKAGV